MKLFRSKISTYGSNGSPQGEFSHSYCLGDIRIKAWQSQKGYVVELLYKCMRSVLVNSQIIPGEADQPYVEQI